MEILIERHSGEELDGRCLPQFGRRLVQEPRINKQNIFALFDDFLFPLNYSTSVSCMNVLSLENLWQRHSRWGSCACELRVYYFWKTAWASRVVATPDLRPIVSSENANSAIVTSS